MLKHSRTLTERRTPFIDTCLKFAPIFRKIVIIFLSTNTPNNKFLDVTNKETKKVMWHRYKSPSIMNLEQLIFTWKRRLLVLALFASTYWASFEQIASAKTKIIQNLFSKKHPFTVLCEQKWKWLMLCYLLNPLLT